MKKEIYLNNKNIEKKAEKFLLLRNKFKKREIELLPYRTGILVIDMQKYFTDTSSHAYIPSVPPVIRRIKSLINIAEQTSMKIIFTKHIDKDNSSPMTRWWEKSIKPNNQYSQLTPGLVDSIENFVLIEKDQYDAFFNTNLEDLLKNNNITTVIITGVLTHLCCETTARSAFIRGFNVLFPVDCTATYNEQFHKAALLNLAHGFAILTSAKEIYGKLSH
ncbi:MAG: cysteine hydrolase [Candidatus Marinimicrobia bacterium]|nr:cysteine hydrolase [Candidatus Neomarinimicrobiota bacterium]